MLGKTRIGKNDQPNRGNFKLDMFLSYQEISSQTVNSEKFSLRALFYCNRLRFL